MSDEQFHPQSKVAFDNRFALTVFESVYPRNTLTGRALYKVRDDQTLLFYALKVFDLELNDRREIEREILALNNFDLDFIAPKCRAFSISQKQGFLLMDWISGDTLAKKFPFPPQDIYDLRSRVDVLCHLCQALDKVHARKILHRDLKPENVLLSTDRSAACKVRLIDFGMANHRRGNGQEGSSFRAPEQDGRRDFNLRAQVDIFAIGKIAWWLVTGNYLNLWEDDSSTDWQNLDAVDLCAACPLAVPALEVAIKKALAYRPENRYRNVRQFEMALKNCNLREGHRA